MHKHRNRHERRARKGYTKSTKQQHIQLPKIKKGTRKHKIVLRGAVNMHLSGLSCAFAQSQPFSSIFYHQINTF
uniref:Uncharacterized protein n=1 Tax=Arundo donax TaxID=35708 RepID=A0A0A9NDE7_ARUDO